jgi:hypothetical protein
MTDGHDAFLVTKPLCTKCNSKVRIYHTKGTMRYFYCLNAACALRGKFSVTLIPPVVNVHSTKGK